ncbi:MAG: sugar ABC transporter permease [Candidatus Competibacteraceae bacterium]|nr:sugar ABC transporter permease [Candidatus Competibacteraceae bacterium]
MNIVSSFTEWKGYGAATWIGMENYRVMLGDKSFWASLSNTTILVSYIPISTVVTVFVAALLREGIRGWQVYRAVLFIPNLLGPVIVGVVFSIYFAMTGS